MLVGGSDAGVHALYDPRASENGVVRSLGRQAKRADFTNAGISQVRPTPAGRGAQQLTCASAQQRAQPC